MFKLNLFDTISTQVLTHKSTLELNSEAQLITKYQTSRCNDYRTAIILVLKERGYSRLEIGQLLAT